MIIFSKSYFKSTQKKRREIEKRRKRLVHTLDPLGINKRLCKQNQSKQSFAEDLKHRPTKAERILYRPLSKMGFEFQKVVRGYIPDFTHPSGLCVEADGSVHDKRRHYDSVRDDRLLQSGYTVVRFTNHRIKKDLPNVLAEIKRLISSRDANGTRLTPR